MKKEKIPHLWHRYSVNVIKKTNGSYTTNCINVVCNYNLERLIMF
jgi:hypothetical protein